jgi:hypothetical protein
MKLRYFGVGCAAIAYATWFPMAFAQDVFAVRITTVPISLAEAKTITGIGQANATLEGRELVIEGHFEGLQGAATQAELHIGSVRGVRGDAFAEVEVEPKSSGVIGGRVELGRAQIAALREGRMYLQIQSAVAPDGNLWGWLLPANAR